MSSKYEIVDVFWKSAGFNISIIKTRPEDINDKLTVLTNGSGTLSKSEYDKFLGDNCLADATKVFNFFDHAHLTDEEAFDAATELRDIMIRVNPLLDPAGLIINANNVIKIAEQTDVDCRNLQDNPSWDKLPGAPEKDSAESDMMGRVFLSTILGQARVEDFGDDVELVTWEDLGLDIPIRKFNKRDISRIFASSQKINTEHKYKMFIVSKCVMEYQTVLILLDRHAEHLDMELEEIMNALYEFSVSINEFLAWDKIDLDKVKKIQARRKNRSDKLEDSEDDFPLSLEEVSEEAILSLTDRVKTKLIGQDKQVETIVEAIHVARAGLKDEDAPIGVFLLCGRTGIGKTYAAKVFAEEFCGKKNLIRIDCSEYAHSHEVSKLTGAPPSYVGHDDGGMLTNFMKENPFSIVLFDEVEKAHSKLHDILLQIMDDGRLTSGKGETVYFDNALLMMTSNVGVRDVDAIGKTAGFGSVAKITEKRKGSAINKALRKKFRPEFLNRIDSTLVFSRLDRKVCMRIAELSIENIKTKLAEKGITIELGKNVYRYILSKGFSEAYGARPLKRFIRKNIVRPISGKILHGNVGTGDSIRVSVKRGVLNITIEKPEDTNA